MPLFLCLCSLLYTPANTTAAFRLYWSFDLFWRDPPLADSWLPELTTALNLHHVRLLRHRFLTPTTSQFLLSTRPAHSPQQIARYLKGGLQRIVRSEAPQAFRRNYGFRSLGSSKRRVLERYVATQLGHHHLADPRFEGKIARFQIADDTVDFSQPRTTAHSLYWYNLHLVLVNEARWRECRMERLQALRDWIVRIARERGLSLSRVGILPDHLHLAMGVGSEKSPEDVAMCFMNNLAHAMGMKPVFQSGYYVATFGEYDLGVIGREGITAPPG
jgi:REP element-mobilizing transposase RayT